MKQQFELLAPGGDVDSIKAAIIAGADAIYCGLDSFNARNRATNLNFEQLNGVIKLAHQFNCQIFLTLNILILEREIPALLTLLNKLTNTQVDGLIVQDWGLFYLLSKHFKTLVIHASTQVTTHNEGQIFFLNKLGVTRVNLSRELNIAEITSLTACAHRHKIASEVFVHGSYCIGFSGVCYFSSVDSGNSGNRGRCSQPCRDQYQRTPMGNDYPLNLKDNCAFSDFQLLADAGVDSLKIEGRIKGPSYIYSVVNSWSKQLQKYRQGAPLLVNDEQLYKVFNRDFSDGYLQGDINKAMFIDNPRDNTLTHVEQQLAGATALEIEQAKRALVDEKVAMLANVQDKIKDLSIAKTVLTIAVAGKLNSPLKVTVSTIEREFVVQSEGVLQEADKASVDLSALQKRFKGLDSDRYALAPLHIDNLQGGLSIAFKELTAIKNRIAFLLNDGVELVSTVIVPAVKKQPLLQEKPTLAVLIACELDIELCQSTSADIYYKIADSFKNGCTKLVDLFLNNKRLIPWFPAVLIGDDYQAAVDFLKQVQPRRIVTDNSGVAYQAFAMGIDWIAGPYLNITNAFSVQCLSETFNCSGAFISNELNKNQIRQIGRPENVKLYYRLYHPILLMSSRQCFFQQTVGCRKLSIDKKCMQKCARTTSIINLKGKAFVIDKQKGGYPCIYSDKPFLNTDIVSELAGVFDTFFIYFTEIGSAIPTGQNKAHIIRHFEKLLKGEANAKQQLEQALPISINGQYKKGL